LRGFHLQESYASVVTGKLRHLMVDSVTDVTSLIIQRRPNQIGPSTRRARFDDDEF